MKATFLVGGLLMALIGGLTFGASADPGQDLFQKKMCGACHGAGKKAGDLKESKLDKATLVKFMKDPNSVKPGSKMKPVVLSDAELGALADYLLTLRK